MPRPPRIVVLGSINMDLVIRCARLPGRGETIIASGSAEVPGGKGANQAVAAARAQGDVQMIGRVGDDAFATRLMANLRRQRVQVDAVATSPRTPSGIAVVAVEESGENSIMVSPGANGLVCPADVIAAAALIQAADVLLVQLEIPVETVRAAIEVAKTAGIRVILDPAPISSPLPDELLDVDLICPNESEAAALAGSEIRSLEDARRAIAILHQRGPANVIITLGGQGAMVSDGKQVQWIEPLPITPLDTTAAGDAFAGALAVRWAEGASLIEAARFANAAGALAATRAGAQPAIPGRDEIEHLLNP